ncbi:glycosyltransferase family 2 protein [Nocardioides sp.]|uniref:glycosyltransferase n=1 Tax=Nocardioides sp. TaxID=35761 RepID=UPI0027168C52|nr:glycosyltransferase family 2 protein [Nocardioides sp.]MDO9457930.1 glycosyltransferase family 2 protein [Nocardioides sp.]
MGGRAPHQGQPRVRRNEWQTLVPPALDAWEPTLAVSVVIPAYDAQRLLPAVLAGLAAQTYPAHLLEVVVADDGPGGLTLPEVRPERTRVVHVEEGWGRANACHTGALAADGDVLHWLDADMLAERHEVEAQARWHHLVDHVVVLGDKWFVDPAPVLALTPAEVRATVERDGVAALFAGQDRQPHAWVEEIYGRTDRLRQAGWNALRTHAGATASVRRDLYLDSGGMDTSLRLGEDIALGARLGAAGAVFVPDAEALSWHLGHTHVMARRDQVNAYNDPFLADAAPPLRAKRHPGRSYREPYLEVVLDTRGHPADAVTATVDAVLGSSLHDLTVTLLGDWSALHDERAGVLDEASLPTRVVHTTYAGDPRVTLLDHLPETRPAATFRLTLPGAAFAPRPPALEKALLHLEHTHDGLRLVDLPDGSVVRVERTAAFARARRVATPGEDLDDVVTAIAGAQRLTGPRAGFGPSERVRPRHYPRTGGPPVDSDEAWVRIEKALGDR